MWSKDKFLKSRSERPKKIWTPADLLPEEPAFVPGKRM
jgi:hypothetical protein